MLERMAGALFPCPPEKVWQVVTDPTRWVWPCGLRRIWGSPDGSQFFAEDDEGMETVFRITDSSPGQWYAVELENQKVVGQWRALFFQMQSGTQIGCRVALHGKTPAQRLQLWLHLRRWQQECLKAMAEELRQ